MSKSEIPATPKPVPKPAKTTPADLPPEIGGYKGQEPTTHGDWQHKGRVSDF
jgi:hypothetical protein